MRGHGASDRSGVGDRQSADDRCRFSSVRRNPVQELTALQHMGRANSQRTSQV